MSLPLAIAESIISGLPDAAILLDPELSVIAYNTAYQQLCGLRPRQLRKKLDESGSFELLYSDPRRDREEALATISDRRLRRFHEIPLHMPSGEEAVGIICYVPVIDGDTVLGVMQILRDVSGESRMQGRYKELVAAERARAEELEVLVDARTRELAEVLEKVTRLSRTDALTGVLNRRAFMEGFEQTMALACRHLRPVGLLMCDLDFFKRLNDTHGHQSGDLVLKMAAEQLAGSIRGTDILGRFGGEEFIVVLPETDAASLLVVAERCVQRLRDMPMAQIIQGAQPQTISIGAAVFPDHATNGKDLIARADEALYERKRGGRDGFTLFGPT